MKKVPALLFPSIVTVAVIGLFLYLFVAPIKAVEETKKWIPTNAVVLSSDSILTYSDEDHSYCALIKISFFYQSKKVFSNLEIPEQCKEIESQIKDYLKDQKVVVLVNPENPNMTRSLDFPKRKPAYIFLFLALICLISLLSILLGNKSDDRKLE